MSVISKPGDFGFVVPSLPHICHSILQSKKHKNHSSLSCNLPVGLVCITYADSVGCSMQFYHSKSSAPWAFEPAKSRCLQMDRLHNAHIGNSCAVFKALEWEKKEKKWTQQVIFSHKSLWVHPSRLWYKLQNHRKKKSKAASPFTMVFQCKLVKERLHLHIQTLLFHIRVASS